MGSVEQKARAMYEAQADPLAAPWERQWEPTKQYWREQAALREQPEARGVVDDETIERVLNTRMRYGQQLWWVIDRGDGIAIGPSHRAIARCVIEAYIAAQQPGKEGGGEYPEAAQVCAEAYQVVGSLLDDLGIFGTERADKILDNLSQHKLVHKDVLPWPSFEKPAPPSAPVEAKARAMFEAQADKLAAPWDRQWEPTKQYWREKAHQALTQQPAQAAPGWKLVPVEPTDDMLNAYQEEQCRWSNITHVDDDATQSLWSAMLAAAPTPPGDDAAGGGHD